MESFPKIQIFLEVANTPDLSEKLLNGDIDMAICSSPNLRTDLYFEPLFKEEFVVILPENHPSVKKAVIEPMDLPGHRLLVTSATCPYQGRHEEVLLGTREHELDTMDIGSVTYLKYYVERGIGMAIVSEDCFRYGCIDVWNRNAPIQQPSQNDNRDPWQNVGLSIQVRESQSLSILEGKIISRKLIKDIISEPHLRDGVHCFLKIQIMADLKRYEV